MVAVILLALNPEVSRANAPSVPTGVSLIASSTSDFEQASIRVTWNANPEVDGYTVYLRRTGASTDLDFKTISQANTTEWTFTNLAGGVSYSVQLIAIKAAVPSARSAAVTATPTTKPKSPDQPNVSAGIKKATVAWTAVPAANNGGSPITSYIVTEVNSNTQVIALATETSKEVTGLSAGAVVEFTVAAVNAASTAGSVSQRSSALTLANTPTAPSLLSALSPEDGKLTLSWTPAADGGSAITQQKIYLYKNSIEVKSENASATATTLTFAELSSGSYQAKVSALNAVGEGPLSSFSPSVAVTAIQQVAVVNSSPSNPPSGGSGGGGGGGGGGFAPAPGGGGGGGGGFAPAPAPSPSPTPSSSPSPSASPTPSPSPSATTQEKSPQVQPTPNNQGAPQSNNSNVPLPAPKPSPTKPIAIAPKATPLRIVIPAADGTLSLAKPTPTLASAVTAKATSKESLQVSIKAPTVKSAEKISSYKVTITTSKGKSKTVTLRSTSSTTVNIKGLPVADTYTLEINAVVNGKTQTVSKSKITLATKKKK
jgi:hypothetical protein